MMSFAVTWIQSLVLLGLIELRIVLACTSSAKLTDSNLPASLNGLIVGMLLVLLLSTFIPYVIFLSPLISTILTCIILPFTFLTLCGSRALGWFLKRIDPRITLTSTLDYPPFMVTESVIAYDILTSYARIMSLYVSCLTNAFDSSFSPIIVTSFPFGLRLLQCLMFGIKNIRSFDLKNGSLHFINALKYSLNLILITRSLDHQQSFILTWTSLLLNMVWDLLIDWDMRHAQCMSFYFYAVPFNLFVRLLNCKLGMDDNLNVATLFMLALEVSRRMVWLMGRLKTDDISSKDIDQTSFMKLQTIHGFSSKIADDFDFV